jgi:type I restriction enzyme S subunit
MKRGWEIKRLGELGEAIREQAKIFDDQEYELWSVPSFETGTPETSFGRDIGSAKLLVRPDDVLICKINPRINRVWLVEEPIDGRDQISSTEWLVFRANPDAGLSPTWLIHFVSSPKFREWIESEVTGATGSHTRAKADGILRQEMPVPPLAEQQRIVGVLDEAFEGLATAKANAEKNLQNARALFESHLQSVFTQRGKGWVNKRLEEVLDVQPQNGWSPPAANHSDSGTPVLTLSSVTGFVFRPEKLKYTSATTDPKARYWIRNGDFLITRSNTPELVGHVAIASGIERPTIYPDLIMRMNPDPAKAITEFLYYQMRTPALRKEITGRAQGANPTMKKISNAAVRTLPIVLPPLNEQRAIVATLNTLLGATQHLAAIYEQKLAALEALKKSLLHQAFSGEL